jgi:outer membrane protein assembly factor BamB
LAGLWIPIVGLLALHAIAGQSAQKGRQPDKRDQTNPQIPGSAAEAGATSKSILALPFKRSWQYLTDRMILLAPTVDGDKIYLPLQEGRVICLDLRSGSLLWSSDSGGRVTAPVAISRSEGASVIFVTSEMLVPERGLSSGLLRALDPTTGVALWARDFPRPFKSPIFTSPGRIYIGSTDGALYALSSVDGSVLWKLQTQGEASAGVLITAKALYFGSDDGALRAVNPQNGSEIWKYQTTGPIVCLPVADNKHIYFGSGDGYIYSLDLLEGKLKWKSKTGASVQASPVLAGDKLVVGSLDNFLYVMSRSNGDRVWKRRLDNRIVFPVIVEGDALVVAPYRGDHVPIFLMSDGRRVNYYRLNRGHEIVASPSFSDGTLLVPTDKGLIAAVPVAPARSDGSQNGAKNQMPAPEPLKKPTPRPLPPD